jgi:hypothetical protein
MQRPSFVRRTKHSGVGHEDIGYSYVVIRRGPRPISTTVKTGRIGGVGRSVIEKEALSHPPMKELQLHSESLEDPDIAEASMEHGDVPTSMTEPQTPEMLQEDLRLESYGWPRLVFPPLKKSGHIILDGCTPEGESLYLL